MNYVLFFVGIIFILAGFMMYRYKGKKKGRKFLIIGIIIGLLLIDQCRAGVTQNAYKDAKKRMISLSLRKQNYILMEKSRIHIPAILVFMITAA